LDYRSFLSAFPLLISAGLAQQAPPQPVHESVVVTGAYEPLALEEVDRSLTLLPARQQSLLLGSLTDLLKLEPSLDFRERAPGGVQTDLSIRGGGYGSALVLLNGQRLNDAQTGHHNMDIPVPLDAVTRVEVLRGSGSTMYGSDAVSGVVNIITEPAEGFEARLRTAVGSFGTNQQSGSLAGAVGKVSERLVFSRALSTGFAPDRDYRNLQLSSMTHWTGGWGPGDLTLAYMDHPFGADQFYGNYPSWENTKTWSAAAQQAFGENTTASFSFRRHSDLFVLYRDRPAVYANHHETESYQGALRRRETVSNLMTVSYGVEGLHESMASSNLGMHARSRGAAYAAADFRALRRFSLSLSAREEFYRRGRGEFSPTVAAGYWLSAKWKLRASASRAFRVASYTELYYHDPANQGSPGLRPERAWTYEGGATWNGGGKVRADVTLFNRRERDGIDYFRATPTDIWRALNIQNLNFSGVEGSLRVVPMRGQTLDFRYTGLRATQDTAPLGFTKYSFSQAKHSGVAAWQASLKGGILLRTRVGALDRRGQSPYALWDVYAASSRGRVRPFLQFANLTSASYQETPGVWMPGRSVLGGVELLLWGR
jgi:iron complex outermembrane recepter protein